MNVESKAENGRSQESDLETNSSRESTFDEENETSVQPLKAKIRSSADVADESSSRPNIDSVAGNSAKMKSGNQKSILKINDEVKKERRDNVVEEKLKKIPKDDNTEKVKNVTQNVEKNQMSFTRPNDDTTNGSLIKSTDTNCANEAESPKEVVIKRIIKVKKKKLKPKIDVIETTPLETSIVNSETTVLNKGDRASPLLPSNSVDEKTHSEEIFNPPNKSYILGDVVSPNYEFKKTDKLVTPSHIMEEHAPISFNVKEHETKNMMDKSGNDEWRDNSTTSKHYLESLVNVNGDKESNLAINKYRQKYLNCDIESTNEEAKNHDEFEIGKISRSNKLDPNIFTDNDYKYLNYDIDSKTFGRIKTRDEFEFDKISRNNKLDPKGEIDDDDDIIENITKYLSKKLPQNFEPVTNPRSKSTQKNSKLDSELDDSDDEICLERYAPSDKQENHRMEAERGRGEAFMDQVRRERSLKSTRQRRDSLFQPKRRGNTDEKVTEKTKNVKALIDKQIAVVDHLRSSIQDLVDLEILIKELKAESLEQKAELDNLEDLFDIIHNKYKHETATAAEALRMQKKELKDKVIRNEIYTVLQTFFAPQKNNLTGILDTENNKIRTKIDMSGMNSTIAKNNVRDKLKNKESEVVCEKNALPSFGTSGFNFSATKDFNDKFLMKSKSGNLNQDDDPDKDDTTSLSADEFINRIRNKYAIVSTKLDRKMNNTNFHVQDGNSFLQKFNFSKTNSEEEFPLNRNSLTSKTFNNRGDTRRKIENPSFIEHFRARKT